MNFAVKTKPSDKAAKCVEFTNVGEFYRYFERLHLFPKTYYFKRPLMIRKKTGLVRQHVDAGTWEVEVHDYGILIYPHLRKKNPDGPALVKWSDIDYVIGSWDSAYDD